MLDAKIIALKLAGAPRAHAKAKAIADAAEAFNLQARGLIDQANKLVDRITAATGRASELAHWPSLPDSRANERVEAEIEEAERLASELKADVARLRQRAHQVRERPEIALAHAIERFLLAHMGDANFPGNQRLVDAEETRPPKLAKNETRESAVARIRNQIAELHAEMHAVRSAPIPSSEAFAIVEGQVNRLAVLGQPDVFQIVEHGQPGLEFARQDLALLTRNNEAGIHVQGQIVDTLAVVAWAFRDEILAKLKREIDQVADDANAFGRAERAAKLDELAAAVLAAERDEEAVIVMSEAAGVDQAIARRADADVRAVLGLAEAPQTVPPRPRLARRPDGAPRRVREAELIRPILPGNAGSFLT